MPDAATPSRHYEIMRRARYFPRRLDSRRPDGGVIGLMPQPVAETPTGDADAQVFRTEDHPLLIQHAAETDKDFAFRAAIAAPRGTFWYAVQALAGRPFTKGLSIGGDVPEELREDGAWTRDVDGRGTDLRSFASAHAPDTAGYGLAYLLAAYNREAQRPVLRFLDADSVIRVVPGPGGLPQRLHVVVTKSEYERVRATAGRERRHQAPQGETPGHGFPPGPTRRAW